MYLTEQEIMDTPKALKETLAYFEENEKSLEQFFKEHRQRKFTFLGCGSSYMLAKGAAVLFASFEHSSAIAIPAGDYILNPQFWQEAVRDSIVMTFSRSGRTTELIRAVKQIKESLQCPVISISMEGDNEITPMADLSLTLSWCYDKSVCQTRTVTNLYAMSLLIAATYSEDSRLIDSLRLASEKLEAFQKENLSCLEQIAGRDWDNIVVLADGAVSGIAEEGALAFTEIAMLSGRYSHVLDYRHGPIVINNERTLSLILLHPNEEQLQRGVVEDIQQRGGFVVTVSNSAGNPRACDAHIQVSGITEFPVMGILFIYIAQMLAFKKALILGGNPDAPKGLDAFVALK